ncbi:MAG: XrtA-associated ATPase, partial [Burkholderiaceae bacterium]|nr:XrtA-associated ATPase [Burkholderiaceae bacterium]
MYETFYGLTGKPFQLNPDPAFYFGSKGHVSAYSYLKYGVYQGEGFIVITGEIGAGKTTLVRTLLSELDPRKVVAAQLISTQLEADDLLRAVATAFGIPVKGLDKAQLLATIEAFLTALVGERRRALLVVDEAQNLSPRAMEELRMLSNFQLGEHALLQSFLVGQPELRNLLREPSMQQLRQRVIASYHLGPMDKEETRAYIEHRLKRVGWKNDPEFEPEAFEAIFTYTEGVPRRINILCNRL